MVNHEFVNALYCVIVFCLFYLANKFLGYDKIEDFMKVYLQQISEILNEL